MSFFLLSTIKFLFTPFAGPAAGLNFWETYFSCVLGGLFSAFFFFYFSSFFMKRYQEKKRNKIEQALKEGKTLIPKKTFTKTNKLIVRLKRKFGIVGISFYAPLFLSVPIGSIITAKFFRHDKRTFPLVILGMFKNGLITTGITYLFTSLF
ncbi:MAG: hypothetical protein HYU67_12845 [Flavobacteriia bacterium]|nr:hypothetical protein [Flavobacteriia bacterium]